MEIFIWWKKKLPLKVLSVVVENVLPFIRWRRRRHPQNLVYFCVKPKMAFLWLQSQKKIWWDFLYLLQGFFFRFVFVLAFCVKYQRTIVRCAHKLNYPCESCANYQPSNGSSVGWFLNLKLALKNNWIFLEILKTEIENFFKLRFPYVLLFVIILAYQLKWH